MPTARNTATRNTATRNTAARNTGTHNTDARGRRESPRARGTTAYEPSGSPSQSPTSTASVARP